MNEQELEILHLRKEVERKDLQIKRMENHILKLRDDYEFQKENYEKELKELKEIQRKNQVENDFKEIREYIKKQEELKSLKENLDFEEIKAL